jgi:AcrR family transcriptional regulator
MIGASPPKPRPPVKRRRKRRRRIISSPVESDSTRVKILHSAAAAFRKLGYHGTTVERIARSLKMEKGNLYYYFRNKEEILFACHQYSLDRLIHLLDGITASTAPPDEKLRMLIAALVHTILDELHGTGLFIDLVALTPAHVRTIITRRDRVDRGMRQLIADGAATGVFASRDAKLISFAILGAVNWIPRWFRVEGPASSEAIADCFAGYLVSGLKQR